MKKILLKIIIWILIIYLIVSSVYIFKHINFGPEPTAVGMGFKSSTNMIRTFMGLKPTYNTYEGVPPVYLISVIIRILIAILLFTFYHKVNQKFKIEDKNNKG